MRIHSRLVGTVLVLTAAACFKADPEFTPPPPADYDADVGEVEWADFRDQVPRVLMRHSFDLMDRNEPPSPRVRTSWMEREPFPDEREAGAQAARTQVVVRGIPIRDSSKFLVTVVVLNQIQKVDSGSWAEMGATPLFTEYADGITRALAAGLHGG